MIAQVNRGHGHKPHHRGVAECDGGEGAVKGQVAIRTVHSKPWLAGT